MDAVSCIIMGDLIAQHLERLRFSNKNSTEGRELEFVSCAHGLRQFVSRPARGPHLFDFVLSDLAFGIRCRAVTGIHGKDHMKFIQR